VARSSSFVMLMHTFMQHLCFLPGMFGAGDAGNHEKDEGSSDEVGFFHEEFCQATNEEIHPNESAANLKFEMHLPADFFFHSFSTQCGKKGAPQAFVFARRCHVCFFVCFFSSTA
jgi:hypothetical protein